MTHHEDEVRQMLRRAQLLRLDDSGSQQLLDLSGLKSDKPRQVPRLMGFGFSSSPPAGADFLLLALGGGASRAMALGGEHADYRPKNRPPGSTIVYDAYGSIVSLVEQNIRIVHAAEISIEAPVVTIKGALTVTETFNVQNLGGDAAPATIAGSFNVTGSIAADGDVTAGTISVRHHNHPIPSGNSGPPNP